MGDFAYVNGAIVASDKAMVSVFDAGFMFGDGLFETLRAYNGRPFQLDRHLDRLSKSLAMLEIKNAPDSQALTAAVDETIQANGEGDCVVRLTVTRGTDRPTTVITTRQIPYTPDQYEKGVACITAPETRGALVSLKSLNYLPSRLAKMEAARAGALEAIFQTNIGMLTEGTMSNVFVLCDGFLKTPDLSLGLLKGITRQTALRLAKESGLTYSEASVMADDMFRSTEAFITNSVMEIMPVVKVDGRTIGDGLPGPVTRRLHESYKALT